MTNSMLAMFDWATSWPIILLAGLVVAYAIYAFFGRKKYVKQEKQMRDELKVGDKIVTNAGVYGTIVEMSETNFGKIALIETGEGNKKSYMSINASVILAIDTKVPVVLDENGNIIDPANESQPKIEDKKQKKITAKSDDKSKEDAKAELSAETQQESADFSEQKTEDAVKAAPKKSSSKSKK